MQTLTPLHDNIVVKPMEENDQMHGNIYIPDMGRDRPEMGNVVAVGTGRISEYGVEIKPKSCIGETVVIPKIGFIRIEFHGEEYYIGPEKEVLARIDDFNSLDDRDQL